MEQGPSWPWESNDDPGRPALRGPAFSGEKRAINTSLKSSVVRDGASQVALVVKNLPASVRDIRDVVLIPGSGQSLWRRAWRPTPVFLPGESQDRGAWWATVHGVAKSHVVDV